MVDGGRPLEVLDSILEQYRVVQHGVAIYFGSADKLNREHLKKLKRLVKPTNTPGSPITCAGEASMGDMLMIFYPIFEQRPAPSRRQHLYRRPFKI